MYLEHVTLNEVLSNLGWRKSVLVHVESKMNVIAIGPKTKRGHLLDSRHV